MVFSHSSDGGEYPKRSSASGKQPRQVQDFVPGGQYTMQPTNQNRSNIPPPINIPPVQPPQPVQQQPKPQEAPQESIQWHQAYNFDARRGLLRAALNMNSDYDTSEHEALRIGLIISQQEAQFGINMYDALLPNDEPKIEELVKKGCTLDEAVMCIFEARFGKMRPISPVSILYVCVVGYFFFN